MWGSKLRQAIFLLVVIIGVIPLIIYFSGVQSFLSHVTSDFLLNQGLIEDGTQFQLFSRLSTSYYSNIIGWSSFVISLVTGIILFFYLKVKDEPFCFFLATGLIFSGALTLYLSQIEFGQSIVGILPFKDSVYNFTFSTIFNSFVILFSLFSYYIYHFISSKLNKKKSMSRFRLCYYLFFTLACASIFFVDVFFAFPLSKIELFQADKRFIHISSLILLGVTIYTGYNGRKSIPLYFGLSIAAFLFLEVILQVYVLIGVNIKSESLVTSALLLEPAAYFIPLFGILFYFMHSYQIITKERVDANSKLEQKNKFIATCVHDLKNPLAIIKQSSELLRESLDKENDSQSTLYEILTSNTDFSLNLVSDLLTVISNEVEKTPIPLQKQELDALLVKIVKSQQLLADKKNISIHLQRDKNSSLALMNLLKMEEVINNIVSNAIKFSEEGSDIFIKRELIKDKLVIQVKDKGIGISKEEQESLFTPFSKGHRKGTANEKGSGLGLAIAKEHMKDQKGDLNLVSSEGNGTIAIIELSTSDETISDEKQSTSKKAVSF